jgi:SNF2 family DNA or RNA helicase
VQQLLTLLPTAKVVTHKGQQLVAVPHRLDEVRVLNNIGIRAPSPIKYHYKWSGMYKPFKAQLDTSAFLTLNRRAFVLSEMGTGKTLAALWAYDYLRSLSVLNRMLVVCPLSTMERTWGDELFKNFPHLDYVVLHGTAERRKKLLKQDADIYIVNHDGVKIIADELKKRDDITLVISDEIAQAARNARTDRWEVLNDIVNKQQQGTRWCWGMTGTPTPNAPTDAWAQCRLVNPTSVPVYFTRFKDMVMKQVNQFLWVPRVNATEVVYKVMQPSIRFSRAECMDLPPCVFQTRHVDLTKDQAKAYKEMLNRLKTDIDGGEVLAVNEAVKTSKLVQIAAGGVYSTNGTEVFVDATPRLNVVDEIINEAEGKVIVFVPFVSAVKLVAEYLRGKHHTVECIYGEVTKNERDRIFGGFQHGTHPRVIVAQPAAMSHGLTLTAANTIIWYAPIFSNDIYDQACARITRPGQTMAQLIVNIEGSPIERAMYERLRNKQRMQGILLTMVEEGRVEYAD